MFNFRYENVGKNQSILTVVLSGTLDESNCSYLLDCMKEDILEGRTKMIVDCSSLHYISSVGLGMLARVNSRMKKVGGDVKLAGVQGAVANLLNITHFNKLFEMYPDLQAAIAAHGG